MEVFTDTELEMPSDDVLYAALRAHDTRFDGRFFVGVSSTRIYCRAVCTAKMPKRENCTFFSSAAAAEAAGYRPCLKCRPELAPDIPASFEMASIAHSAADIIRDDVSGESLASIAEGLGVSERQLRRVFEGEYGVSPQAYRNTCRLLLAKGLLTDTDMPVTKVAYACGFSSVRRFNDAFSKQYRMPPSRLRKGPTAERASSQPIVMRIGYRPPYRFDLLLDFLSFRAIEGVELVEGGAYYRSVSLETLRRGKAASRRHTAGGGGDAAERDGAGAEAGGAGDAAEEAGGAAVGWVKVEDFPEKNCLRLTVSHELFDELPAVVAKVRRLFDTDCVPQTVEEGLADFYRRVPASRLPGIRVPCSFDGFEMAVRAILGQQVTVKAANTLAGRVAHEFGTAVALPVDGLDTAFPPPEAFCTDDAQGRLGRLGVVRQRAKAICALAQALCDGSVAMRPGLDVGEVSRRLLALPGIGEWTVQYLLMRAFDYPDAFPAADYGVKSAFPDLKEREIKALSDAWRPWRSYAVMSLWCTPHEA